LVMIDILGQSYAEVAETMNIPVGTVKSRVHRARDSVARLLADEYQEGDSEI
jgi:RNA polymerase sigma-70 factor, ECF subfamily